MNATLCSRNRHKARELERLLPGWTLEPLDRDDLLERLRQRVPELFAAEPNATPQAAES